MNFCSDDPEGPDVAVCSNCFEVTVGFEFCNGFNGQVIHEIIEKWKLLLTKFHDFFVSQFALIFIIFVYPSMRVIDGIDFVIGGLWNFGRYKI